MGKNTVTEDDLLAGVGGGFGNIGNVGSGRPVRDNPFRDTRPTLESEAPQPKSVREAKQEKPAAAEPPAVVPPPQQPRAQEAAPPAEAHASPRPQTRAPKVVRAFKKERKTDIYSEKMSTFLTPSMRDDLEMTARLLQRNRLVKGESITVHTLIRSGVRVVTELLEFTDADVISSEEELDALVRKKLGS